MDYKLYFLNRLGHINFRHDLEADNDEHAIELSRAASDGRAMELWTGERRVKIFKAEGAGEPSSQPWLPPARSG